MTGRRRTSLILAMSVLVIVASPGCRNPFQAGLGDKVDIDRPVVTLDTPDLGSFLRGTVTFSGQASDDTQVTAVMLSFDGGASWDNADHYEPADKRWWYDLDTATRPNGRLAVTFRGGWRTTSWSSP